MTVQQMHGVSFVHVFESLVRQVMALQLNIAAVRDYHLLALLFLLELPKPRHSSKVKITSIEVVQEKHGQ